MRNGMQLPKANVVRCVAAFVCVSAMLITSGFAQAGLAFCRHSDGATKDDTSDRVVRAKLDELFAPWDKSDSPGFALGIVRDGQLVYDRGYGMANLDEDVRLSKHSVMQVWSMTKTFTTVCAALLLDQGKIELDDPVTKFVPEIRT